VVARGRQADLRVSVRPVASVKSISRKSQVTERAGACEAAMAPTWIVSIHL
jgi:hypothetical protein